MSNVIVNDVGAVEQPIESRWEPSSGWTTVRRWRGPQASIIAKELQVRNQGYSTVMRAGPVWELEAQASVANVGGTPGNDLPVDTWELLPNVVEKDILQSDSSDVTALNDHDFRLLRDIQDGTVDRSRYYNSSPPFTGGGNVYDLYKLIISGVTSKTIYQPVLRHTRTVSRSWQVPASLVGVGQVYSKARLIALEMVPPIIIGSLENSGNITTSHGITLYKGWLKTHPTISLSAFSKSQITQDWQWGWWSSFLYTVNT